MATAASSGCFFPYVGYIFFYSKILGWGEVRERSLVGKVGALVMMRDLDFRTVRPRARRDAWTQSPCCSAVSDDTSVPGRWAPASADSQPAGS